MNFYKNFKKKWVDKKKEDFCPEVDFVWKGKKNFRYEFFFFIYVY